MREFPIPFGDLMVRAIKRDSKEVAVADRMVTAFSGWKRVHKSMNLGSYGIRYHSFVEQPVCHLAIPAFMYTIYRHKGCMPFRSTAISSEFNCGRPSTTLSGKRSHA